MGDGSREIMRQLRTVISVTAVRTLAFTLSEMERHWKVLRRVMWFNVCVKSTTVVSIWRIGCRRTRANVGRPVREMTVVNQNHSELPLHIY